MEQNPIIKVEALTIDQAVTLLGGFHLFQWLIIASLACMSPPRLFQILFMVFGAQDSSWKCVSNSSTCLLNGTLPSTNRARCNMLRNDWEYTMPKDFSIASEFDLQCDREWMKHLMNSIVFVGWGVGAVVLGWVADNYGRKRVIYPSQLMVALVGFIFSFIKSVPLLIISRFIIGLFIPACGVQSFVLISEYVSSKHRPVASLLLFVGFATSSCLFALKAYYIQNWKLLSKVCTAPYVITLLSYFFVPESIRWIRLKGGDRQLMDTFRRVAYWNKKEMPTDFYIKPPTDDVRHQKFTVLDIFRTRKMALKSIVLGYTWLANGMVYYSLVFAASDLGGSIYLNFFLLSFIGIPGNATTMYLCNRIGRKKTVIISMLVASIFCAAVAFIQKEEEGKVIRVVCGMIGKLFIGISFAGIYVWAVELYPTTIRANAMGYLQVTSRIGAASAPWVATGLLSVHTAAPYLVMSGASFLASFVLLYIPETSGKPILETADEPCDAMNLLVDEDKPSI